MQIDGMSSPRHNIALRACTRIREQDRLYQRRSVGRIISNPLREDPIKFPYHRINWPRERARCNDVQEREDLAVGVGLLPCVIEEEYCVLLKVWCY